MELLCCPTEAVINECATALKAQDDRKPWGLVCDSQVTRKYLIEYNEEYPNESLSNMLSH